MGTLRLGPNGVLPLTRTKAVDVNQACAAWEKHSGVHGKMTHGTLRALGQRVLFSQIQARRQWIAIGPVLLGRRVGAMGGSSLEFMSSPAPSSVWHVTQLWDII